MHGLDVRRGRVLDEPVGLVECIDDDAGGDDAAGCTIVGGEDLILRVIRSVVEPIAYSGVK